MRSVFVVVLLLGGLILSGCLLANSLPQKGGGPQLVGMVVYVGPGLQLYVADLQTGTKRQITDRGENIEPKWSPDGKRIAFSSRRDGHNREIYLINGDEGNLQRLTYTQNRDSVARWPRWLDNDHLLFFWNDKTEQEVGISSDNITAYRGDFVLAIRSGNITPVYNPRVGLEGFPFGYLLPSPDGKYMATFEPNFAFMPVYIYNISKQEILSRGLKGIGKELEKSLLFSTLERRSTAQMPAWAPDSSRLVYASGGNLWVADLKTRSVRQLTKLRGFDTTRARGEMYNEPCWSPDGRWIMAVHVKPGLFISNRIVIIDPETGQEAKDFFEGVGPDWFMGDKMVPISPPVP